MDSASLTKVQPKTFDLFNVVSATPNSMTVDDNGVHNTVPVDRGTLAPYNAQGTDVTDQDSNTENANYIKGEDKAY